MRVWAPTSVFFIHFLVPSTFQGCIQISDVHSLSVLCDVRSRDDVHRPSENEEGERGHGMLLFFSFEDLHWEQLEMDRFYDMTHNDSQ